MTDIYMNGAEVRNTWRRAGSIADSERGTVRENDSG